jgi:acyl dehydratase
LSTLIDSVALGFTTTATRSFTVKDVRAFAAISGEKNDRLELIYAETSPYGKPTVPGQLTACLFSNLLATQLPNPGSIRVGQMLKLLKLVYVGETVTASVEVIAIIQDEDIVRLALRASTQRGACIDGEAVVRMKRPLSARA